MSTALWFMTITEHKLCAMCKHPIMDESKAFTVTCCNETSIVAIVAQMKGNVFVNIGDSPKIVQDICGLNCLCRAVTTQAHKRVG